jgi:hypothetical protein
VLRNYSSLAQSPICRWSPAVMDMACLIQGDGGFPDAAPFDTALEPNFGSTVMRALACSRPLLPSCTCPTNWSVLSYAPLPLRRRFWRASRSRSRSNSARSSFDNEKVAKGQYQVRRKESGRLRREPAGVTELPKNAKFLVWHTRLWTQHIGIRSNL